MKDSSAAELPHFGSFFPLGRWVIKGKGQQSVPEVASCPPGPERAGGWDKRRRQRAVNAFTFKSHPCPPVYPRVSSQPLMIICPRGSKSTTQHTGLALPKRGPGTKTAGRLQVKNPNKLAERFVPSACLPGPCQDPDFVSASHPIHRVRSQSRAKGGNWKTKLRAGRLKQRCCHNHLKTHHKT